MHVLDEASLVVFYGVDEAFVDLGCFGCFCFHMFAFLCLLDKLNLVEIVDELGVFDEYASEELLSHESGILMELDVRFFGHFSSPVAFVIDPVDIGVEDMLIQGQCVVLDLD